MKASISSKGKRISLGEVEIRKEGGRLIAKCLATYFIMKNEK